MHSITLVEIAKDLIVLNIFPQFRYYFPMKKDIFLRLNKPEFPLTNQLVWNWSSTVSGEPNIKLVHVLPYRLIEEKLYMWSFIEHVWISFSCNLFQLVADFQNVDDVF